MDTIIQKLNDGFPVLADGAMGTLLQQWGHGDVQCLEMLNIDNPEVIAEVARKYLEAGAEIIQTNTFGCSPIKLAEKGLSEKYREISVKAVDIIQQVVGDRAWIAGDYGSCGVSLQPFGDLEIEDYKDSCRKQFLALAEAGVDAFSIETMMDLREGVIAIEMAREVAPDMFIMASATFNQTPAGYFTPYGQKVEQVARRYRDAGADAVGANCSLGVDMMIPIAQQFRQSTSLPIIIRPNAGLPEMVNGKAVWEESPELFAAGAKKLLDAGVNIIGGCCGTTPEHIRAMRKMMEEREKKDRS